MKPVIGISSQCTESDSAQAIVELVERMGADPYVVCEHAEHTVAEDIPKVTSWILMGNDWDIDPSGYVDRYQPSDPRRNVHPNTNSEAKHPKGRARAAYEEELIQTLIGTATPMVGICGGMQRINVVLGGTLHQHLPDIVGDDRHCQRTRGVDPRTAEIPILIEGGTTLADIASKISMPFAHNSSTSTPKVIYENSIHHQAIDRLADGFRRCCVTDVVCKDTRESSYIIKGFEVDPAGRFAGQFILGLQWHPEFCASELGPCIMTRLIQEASFYQMGGI